MTSNMNKAVAVIAAIIGIVAIIPIEALSWWKADFDPIIGSNFTLYINAFGQAIYGSGTETLDAMYLLSGILVIAGALLLLIGGFKSSKAAALFGSIIMILGPIAFLIAHNDNTDWTTITAWLGSDNNFFGSKDFLGTVTWYLNVGFFMAIGGAIVGFLSLRSND